MISRHFSPGGRASGYIAGTSGEFALKRQRIVRVMLIPALAGSRTPELALHSTYSYGYGFRSRAVYSRTNPAPSSGILVTYAN